MDQPGSKLQNNISEFSENNIQYFKSLAQIKGRLIFKFRIFNFIILKSSQR